MSDKKFGWGIIGASRIAAEWVIPAIAQTAGNEVVAVLSSDQGRADAYAKEHAIPFAYSDAGKFLADPRIDAVYVSTTNERHYRDSVDAAKAGKHVLCEKPMALNLKHAHEMIAACDEAKVVLGVNHHMRCMETHRAIRDVLRAGTLGKIVLTRIFFGVGLPEEAKRWRARSVESGAGVFLDLSVHDADLIRFLFDEDIDSITCVTGNSGSTSVGIEDTTMWVAKLKSGRLVEVMESFNTPHAHTSLEIHGTEASLVAKDVLLQKGQGTIHLVKDGVASELPYPAANPYLRVVRQFSAAMAREGEPAATGLDGFQALKAALSARESAATRATVQL
jgi:1,5-anhydro-D-fructose reductase (1,5-anhydro-D-mannitol-forming)